MEAGERIYRGGMCVWRGEGWGRHLSAGTLVVDELVAA